MIPYGRQDISDDDVHAVVEVLRSDFLTQGPMVPRFEERSRRAVDAPSVVNFSSATAACTSPALPSDWVPVIASGLALTPSSPPPTAAFIAALRSTSSTSTRDRQHGCRSTGREAGGGRARQLPPEGRHSRPLCWASVDLATIRRLAERYGFRIIEDATHAIGGAYRNRPVGSANLPTSRSSPFIP